MIRRKRWAAPNFLLVYSRWDERAGRYYCKLTIEHMPAMGLLGSPWQETKKGGRWRAKVSLDDLPAVLAELGDAMAESCLPGRRRRR